MVRYFQEVSLAEARAAFTIAKEVMDQRLTDAKRGKKSQAAATEAGGKRRKRRTKSEIAEDNRKALEAEGQARLPS
jgi:hypothetical protein